MREPKFGANAAWLFGLVTLVLAIAATYLVPRIAGAVSPKAMAAVYTVIFGAGATGAAVLTRASVFGVLGPFAVASLGLGVFYYVTVARAAAAAFDGTLGGAAASAIGGVSGTVFAIAFILVGIAGALAGALFGRRLRVGAPKPLLQR